MASLCHIRDSAYIGKCVRVAATIEKYCGFLNMGGQAMKKTPSGLHHSCLSLIAAGLLAVPTFGDPPTSAPKPPKSNYPITIAGTATLVGKWTCGGNADVHAKPNLSLDPIPGIGYGVQTVVVTTSVAEIECGDSGMNEHLRNSLKEKDFPEIRYRALRYVLVDNGSAVQTSGELTIAGVTKPVGLGAKLVPLPDGGTRVTGKVRINMRDYGVKPPSKLFGALKVANKVTIEFNTVVSFSPDFNLQLFSN
jgi:hypothetical protein